MLEDIFDSIDNEYRRIRLSQKRNTGDTTRLYQAPTDGGGGRRGVANPLERPSGVRNSPVWGIQEKVYEAYRVKQAFTAKHELKTTKLREMKPGMVVFATKQGSLLITKNGFILDIDKVVNVKELRIKKKINQIKNNPNWYQSIVQKAAQNSKSVEEQLRLDAIYCIESNTC